MRRWLFYTCATSSCAKIFVSRFSLSGSVASSALAGAAEQVKAGTQEQRIVATCNPVLFEAVHKDR